MDQKLKNYSSGMQVRLAFSIAIKAQSEILLIDEVLAVGDAAFQKKCFDYFMKLKKEKRTVVLVTHDMGAVRQYCDSGIMIDKGKIVKTGKVEAIAQAYQKLFNDEIATSEQRGTSGGDERWGTSKLYAKTVKTSLSDRTIAVDVTYHANQALEAPVLGFNIYNSRGVNVLEGNTIRERVKTKALASGEEIKMHWEFPNILATDTYAVSVSCCDQGVTEFYDWYNDANSFIIAKSGNTAGMVDPPLTTSFNGKNTK
jgi:ABC-2 type transport system ATP-binding protein